MWILFRIKGTNLGVGETYVLIPICSKSEKYTGDEDIRPEGTLHARGVDSSS